MNLSFNIFGVTVASVRLAVDSEFSPAANGLTMNETMTPLDRGVKAMSAFWVRRMMSGR